MKKLLFVLFLFTIHPSFSKEKSRPDTVTVGDYINSIHDIDFREKEFTINLWLWIKKHK